MPSFDTGTLLLVAVGGAVGAASRFVVAAVVNERVDPAAFPWGTFAVNASGCLLFGFVAGLLEARQVPSRPLAAALLVGLLGGYTTYSAFAFETLSLLDRGRLGTAVAYAAATCVVAVLAVWVGLALAGVIRTAR